MPMSTTVRLPLTCRLKTWSARSDSAAPMASSPGPFAALPTTTKSATSAGGLDRVGAADPVLWPSATVLG
jgi:hypothetical protein